MSALLTNEEKVKVRHHLGYLNVQQAATFQLGIPAGVQTQFIIESAFEKILPEALPKVRQLIAVLDTLEQQMIDDAELAAIDRLDTIEINQKEQMQLRDQYDYHRQGLANLFGVFPNPYDKRFSSGGGINAPVTN